MIRHRSLALVAFLAVVHGQMARGEMVMRITVSGITDPFIIADNFDAGHPTSVGTTTNADLLGGVDGVGYIIPDLSNAGNFQDIDIYGTSRRRDGIPLLDILLSVVSFDNSDPFPATFTVELTDTDFTIDTITLPWQIVGNIGTGYPASTGGHVNIESSFGADNAEFSQTTTVVSDNLGPGSFSASTTAGVPGGNPFSLAQKVIITANAADQTTTFNYELSAAAVPEPTSLVLWGVAAGVGICVARKRRLRGKPSETPVAAHPDTVQGNP